MLRRYLDFCDFQDGGCRHLGFSKIRNFNGRSAVRGQCASLCPISSKSVKRLSRYGNLTVFKIAAVCHLGLLKFKFFNGRVVNNPILHYRTKFRKDQSNRCRDIAIFVIFKTAAAVILDFKKIRNFNSRSAARGQWASSCQISSKSAKMLQRYSNLTDFEKWQPSAIFDLLGAYWDHPRWPLGGLYRCAKCGWNQCSSFDNMKLAIFRQIGLKKPIHAPKIVFFGNFAPKMGSNINETTKRHTLARVRIVWAIKREIPSTGLTCRWVPKTGINENFFPLYFTRLPRSPHGRICTKFGTAIGAAEVITCTIFWWSVKGCAFYGGSKIAISYQQG